MSIVALTDVSRFPYRGKGGENIMQQSIPETVSSSSTLLASLLLTVL